MSNRADKSESMIWVLDLSKVTFSWGSGEKSCQVKLLNGDIVGESKVSSTSPREAAFEALEGILESGPGIYNGVAYGKIALYNPYSSELSVGATPNTITYGDFRELSIPPDGAIGELFKDRIEIEGRILIPIAPSLDIVERAFTLHN